MLDRLNDALAFSWERLQLQHPPQECQQVNCIQSTSLNLTIICVKWGTKYGCDYVNNLYTSCIEYSLNKFNFICLTDDHTGISPSITCLSFLPSTSHWKGWWVKAQLFEIVALMTEVTWILYFDLDTILVNKFNFFQYIDQNSDQFYTLNAEEFKSEGELDCTIRLLILFIECLLIGRGIGINSSIMFWKSGSHRQVFSFLHESYEAITSCVYKFDHYLEMLYFNYEKSDSALSCENQFSCEFLQKLFPSVIVDYLSILTDEGAEPEVVDDKVSIICFPLSPKPHELKPSWLKQRWNHT